MGTSATDVWNHPAYRFGYDKHVETLTESQKKFPFLLDEWLRAPKNLKVVVAGGPGTGKSHTVVSCLDLVNVPQLRMAPTARVASRMKGYTIHSAMRLRWGRGSVLDALEKELMEETDTEECLRKSSPLLDELNCVLDPEIVVIDEIGMVAFWLVEWIFEYFFKRPKPVLCIVMGDPNQLRPVKAIHNLFSAGSKSERIDLKESLRFEEEYGEIVQKLRTFVDSGDETGMFTFLASKFPVVKEIDHTILKKSTRALAYLKSTVEYYNEFYLEHLAKGRKLRLWRKSKARDEFIIVREGCLIFVVQNGVSKVTNGTPLIFLKHIGETDCLECKDGDSIVHVHRNQHGDYPIVIGYAGTIHKFQGDTMDDAAIAINFNDSRDLNLVYTALSRVKSMRQIVAIKL